MIPKDIPKVAELLKAGGPLSGLRLRLPETRSENSQRLRAKIWRGTRSEMFDALADTAELGEIRPPALPPAPSLPPAHTHTPRPSGRSCSSTTMKCQKCHHTLGLVEPVYRSLIYQRGRIIRREICGTCANKLVIEKLFEPPFEAVAKPCEICQRPVFNRQFWKIVHVTCSAACRRKLAQVSAS
jgi:hypothetical protein